MCFFHGKVDAGRPRTPTRSFFATQTPAPQLFRNSHPGMLNACESSWQACRLALKSILNQVFSHTLPANLTGFPGMLNAESRRSLRNLVPPPPNVCIPAFSTFSSSSPHTSPVTDRILSVTRFLMFRSTLPHARRPQPLPQLAHNPALSRSRPARSCSRYHPNRIRNAGENCSGSRANHA